MNGNKQEGKIVLRFRAKIAGRRQRLFIEIPKALREMATPLRDKELLIVIQEIE
jgi:hypothetical protein